MERIIEISVKNRIAWQTNRTEYICGNGDFVVNFLFDSEWDEIEVKTARFVCDGVPWDVVFSGNKCEVPCIVYAKHMEVGVYTGDLRTTTPAFVPCKRSILSKSGVPAAPTPDVYAQIMEQLNKIINSGGSGGTIAKIGYATLLAAAWEGEESPYSQIVSIDGVTKNSQVDLTPDAEQLTAFHEKDLALVAENEGGVVTVFAIGQKPMNDYTIQVTITEVSE